MKTPAFRITSLFLLMTLVTYSQVGIGTTTPHTSSILDITSNTRGVLTPRMTSGQRLAISMPATGLCVYDSDEDAFYYYDDANWVKMITESSISDRSGWADYSDGTYTSLNPLGLEKDVQVNLPNDAANIVDFQKPKDVVSFYDRDKQTITGRSGDGINVVIEFKAIPTSASVTRLTVSIDIGGAIGEIFKRDFVLAKGAGEEHFYLSSFNAYTLGTFQANGGAVKISSTANAEVYDIRYLITRTHKTR